MCNPNALLYQQMVSSPNTYWLTFFMKREVNVMCWNYRSYGKSKNPKRCCMGLCDAISPENIKLDSERVLDFLVKKLQVRGKIGIYGRSLGGIASTHLANKYPDKITALITDRTFCDLDVSSERRLFGKWSKRLYKFVSWNWKVGNDINFIQSHQCFKIVTCDPLDDVVDNFSVLCTGVAQKLSKYTYQEEKWYLFYECLKLVYEIESILYEKLDYNEERVDSFKLVNEGDGSLKQKMGNVTLQRNLSDPS